MNLKHQIITETGPQRRICMLSHSFYESDNRIMRYAEALVERGNRVEVVSLRRSPQQHQCESLNGVVVHRIQDRFGKRETSPWSYLWPLLRFVLVATRWLRGQSQIEKFDLV